MTVKELQILVNFFMDTGNESGSVLIDGRPLDPSMILVQLEDCHERVTMDHTGHCVGMKQS